MADEFLDEFLAFLDRNPDGTLPVMAEWEEYVIRMGQRSEFRGRRQTIYVVPRPMDDDEPFVAAVTNRIQAIVGLTIEEFIQLDARHTWRASIVLNNPTRGDEVLLDHPWGTHRAFTSVQDIRDHMGEAIFLALENMAQSDTEYEINDLTFEIRFDREIQNPPQPAQGRLKQYIRRSIAASGPTPGLFAYDSQGTLCGFKAVVYALALKPQLRALWNGPVDWVPDTRKLIRHKTRFTDVAKRLAQELGVGEPYNWDLGDGDAQSTAQRLVMLQPKLQVVVYNEVTRQVMEHCRGLQYDSELHGREGTLLMSYTTGHIHLIKSFMAYMGKEHKGSEVVCWACLTIQLDQRHPCPATAGTRCDLCYNMFSNAEQLRDHEKPTQYGFKPQCPQCRKLYHNPNCMAGHRCTARDKEICEYCQRQILPGHQCNEYNCLTCKKQVQYGVHHCPLLRLEPPPEDTTAEEEGKDYYAFDVESLLIPMPNNETLHVVNLVVVRRCFAEDEEWIFNTLDEFIVWSLTLPSSTFYAHNFRGYDGRLLFEYLLDKRQIPQEVLWVGSKLLQMKYSKNWFKDTLPHLTTSLAQLPRMMGLDESQFKKGFFPYLFNTPENQDYVGVIPDPVYFDPQNMKSGKRAEFEEWYQEQLGKVYVFKRELIEYCQSDVRILAKTIETYMKNMMVKHPYNPFRSLTSASYAKTIYQMYYMPENMLYRTSIPQAEHIRQSMHGGRTDTRKLLKEWNDEEIQQGYYGCYQDVQSLYPTVQFYDPMPVGVPRIKFFDNAGVAQPSSDEINKVFGFVCCDIEPTRFLFHPVLVSVSDEGRLVADLKPKEKLVVPTPELHLALKHGYKITKVHWWYDFDQSTDMFRSYFRTFLKDKLDASGVPKWVQTAEDWEEFARYHREELGIELNREEMISNPSRKTGAKVLCNSLWGKFAERKKSHNFVVFDVNSQNDAIYGLERKWIDGDIDISYRRYNGNNTQMCMVYNTPNVGKEAMALHLHRTNIALASMVTSHARCRLWKELHKLGKRVLYHDTDSIIYEHSPHDYNIPLGRYLGEWEDETGGLPITKFVSTGPKCYSYVVRKPDGSVKSCTKAKGLTLNSHNAKLIHFESMKQLVVGDIDSIAANALLFKYNRNEGTMVTRNILKLFRKTYNKGRIDPTDWTVYPFE